MAPLRGNNKRKRKVEKTVNENSLISGSVREEGSDEWWNNLSRKIAGDQSPSSKMSRNTFDYICSLVKDHMMVKTHFNCINGNPMSMNDIIGIALRRLGSGDSLVIIGESFGVNQCIVSQVTWRFVEAVEKKGLHHIQWPITEKEKTEIKQKFEKIRGLSNCCGAIDTTHIKMIMTSSNQEATWRDKNGNHSMVLQAIVGPNMKFLDITTGWPGKMSDSSILENCTFFKLCQEGEKLNGKMQLREYIIGDSGYPLLPWLITPYQGKELLDADVEFNNRLVATHDVAKKALVMLKDRWRMIQGELWRPDRNRLPRIILVCCILHNIIIDMGDKVEFQWTPLHDHDPGYKGEVNKFVDKDGAVLRDMLSLCFSEK